MSAPRVVIFEADLAFADELREAFERRGCEVLLHSDGADAADYAERAAPDLIVLAVELPNRNGFAICNQVKKLAALAAVPLVLISSHSPPETFEQHAKLRTRADDYAHKPISAEELATRCEVLTAGQSESVIDVSDEAVDARHRAGDSDLSGITDAAFEHIMLEDGSRPPPNADDVVMAEGLPPVPDDFEDFTTVSSVASLRLPPDLLASATRPAAVTARPPARPPAPPIATRPPPASMRPGGSELDALREQVASLEASLSDAQRLAHDSVAQQAQGERVRAELEESLRGALREVDELKARAARPTEARSLGSTREFLEVREALNRKDKEILTVRDQLNQRDHELLELRDKLLQQDLARADLDERLDERDREVDALRERLSAQEHAAQRRERELDAQAAAAREESSASIASLQVAAAAAASAHELALSAQREAAETARAETLAATQRAHDEALRTLRQEHDDAIQATRAAHDEALRTLRQEQEETLRALREEHEQALALRATALDAERTERDEALRARDIAHAEALAEAEATRASLAAALSDTRASLHETRASLSAALDAARARVEELESRMARRDAITERARRAAEIASALLDELAEPEGDDAASEGAEQGDAR